MSDLSDSVGDLKGQGDLITFGRFSFISIKVSVKDTTTYLSKVKSLWFAVLFAENDVHQMTTISMRSQGCHGWRLHKEL
jgi:hypothetical protein